MLTMDGCRARQNRLLKWMAQAEYELFVTADFRTVYYLTGALTRDMPACLLVWCDGRSALITSADPPALADQIVKLEAYSIDRSIDFPVHDAVKLAKDLLGTNVGKCALEQASAPGLLQAALPHADDATAAILRLRKRKEADEIDEIRQMLRYSEMAYTTARETIAPGLSEIDVYLAMYSSVVRQAGASIHFAGDFACGTRAIRGGGPPTPRLIEPNDLYILDLFPERHLYFSDTCRTFAVAEPNTAQRRAWESVVEALKLGERTIRVGAKARSVYWEIKRFLDSQEVTGNSFWHHAGHGIGLHGPESPRIIPGSDDEFEVGDVFTLEPGVYSEALRGGVRIENNYVLRESGLENLFEYPRFL